MMNWLRFTLLIALNVHFIQFTVGAPATEAPHTPADSATSAVTKPSDSATETNQNPSPSQNPGNTPSKPAGSPDPFMSPQAGNTGVRSSLDMLWGMTMNTGLMLGNIVTNVFSETFNAVGSLVDNILGMGVMNRQNTASYNNQIAPQFQRG